MAAVSVNLELVKNLASSDADNAAADIVATVDRLAREHGWTLEEVIAVADAMIELRQRIIVSLAESWELLLKDTLK